MTERRFRDGPVRSPGGRGPAEEVVLRLPGPGAGRPAEGSLTEEAHLLGQLRLLNQVAQAAAGNLNVDRLLAAALRELDRHLPMNLCGVWLAEDRPGGGVAPPLAEDEPVLVLSALGVGQEEWARDLGLAAGLRLPLSRTPFAGCWLEGEAVYTLWGPPERMQAFWRQPPAERPGSVPGAVPCFATPLRAGEQTVGVLHSVCHRPGGFTSEQVQMLYLVADLLGPAISNCRLHGRLRATYEALRTTQQELVRTEKMRALGEMAGGMAHDFNNSLCGVLGFLELTLRDESLSAYARSHLERARTCALDAAQTVRRVQNFARVRRADLAYQPLDVNQLLRETVELTRPRWESLTRLRKGPITLALRGEATGRALGNAPELREVLTNLIFNAVDAMPAGGTLAVGSRDEGGQVLLTVADTGVGMPAEVQQRLFEPFFTTKGERGCGLGLSVAFGIISQHGGDIRVASEVGRGSTFTVRVPAAAPARVGEAAASSPAEPAAPLGLVAPLARPSGLRVLVVEDEDAVAQLLETVLQTLGYRPRLARSGGAAVEALAEEAPDLVLTDLGLPDMSGREVARAVAERTPGTPVVLLTGWGDQLNADGEAVPGVARILAKPVTIQKLAETLKAVSSRPAAGGSALPSGRPREP
jgi:signal transduction histidine kinase/ActR/RegA family two-component response regulator